MFTIDREMLNDNALRENAEQAIFEITMCLRKTGVDSDIRVVLATYLLHNASKYNSPLDYGYQDITSVNAEYSQDLVLAIKENISKSEWEELLPLSIKYSSEVFAVAAVICEPSPGFKMNWRESTPASIINLSKQILNTQPGDKVADLCCGYGSFLISNALDAPKSKSFGFEINTNSKLIAEIRSRLVAGDINIILQDVFELADDSIGRRFDRIFSNYPFKIPVKNLGRGAKFFERISRQFPGLSKVSSSDWVFNALIMELLEEDGKAIAIMTNGSTWNGIDTPMRKFFVENGFIESVIALPGRLFSFTSIPTTLIVLSHNNKEIRVVDASKICQQGRRYNEFSENDISTIINALTSDTEYSKTISVEELRENEYILSLSRYLKDEISFENAMLFEDVIKSISRGAPCTAHQLDEMVSDGVTNMQYLMLANIQNGIIDEKLPYLSHIESKYEKYCLKDNDLILSKNGYPYKVAVARIQEGQKVLANGNLYIIELDQEKVDPYYLKAFFESDQGVAVLKSITVGATIPNIGVDNLKKVEIPIPSLAEQKKIAEKYQSIMDEIVIYKLKLEKATSRLHHIFDEESEG